MRRTSTRARATTSPGPSSSPPPSTHSPSGVRSAYDAWSPDHATCVAHTSPWPKPKPGTPAASSSVASWPVRPWRPSRRCVPEVQDRRCGARSRHHRPVRSSSSVARAGTGSADRTAASTSGEAPELVTDVRSRSSPASVSSRVSATSQPASASRPATVTVASATDHSQSRTSGAHGASRGRGAQPLESGQPGEPGRALPEQAALARRVERGVRHRRDGGGDQPRRAARRPAAPRPSAGGPGPRRERARARCSRPLASGGQVRLPE